LYINIFKNIYMCITYIPKEKRERERGEREKQQVGWPKAVLTLNGLSVRLVN
jgi:hypothetical protein